MGVASSIDQKCRYEPQVTTVILIMECGNDCLGHVYLERALGVLAKFDGVYDSAFRMCAIAG